MSASEPARLTLRSPNALLEITVVGGDFRPVASGVGRLEATVPPGLYQVVARAGSAVERRLISLGPGEEHVSLDLAVAYPSAAPVAGSTTSHEYHMVLAEEVTRRAADTGAASWCAIVVRDVRGLQGPPLERSTLARIELRDRSLRPLAGFDDGWDHRPAEAAAAWGGALEPGPYVLRIRGGEGGPIDRSVWIQPGWQTVVFLTVHPSEDLSAAISVHMVDVALWWSPVEDGVAEAAELASAALQEGRPIVPAELLRLLLDTKFRNPVFGLMGAHALLLGSKPDPPTVSMVLGNLDILLPGHPDVIALHWLAAERLPGLLPMPVAGSGIDWPPMLLPSYQALLRADAGDPGVLRDGSFAERIAATSIVQGIWTAWRPIPAVAPPPIAPSLEAAADHEMVGGIGAVLASLAPTADGMTRLAMPDLATARVARFLASIGQLEGPQGTVERFSRMTVADLALATHLPTSTVERSVRGLHRLAGEGNDDGGGDGEEDDDPGPRENGDRPGNGDGGPHIPLALLMAVGLLLLVGIGFAIGLGIVADERASPSPSPSATASTPGPTSTPLPTPTPTAPPTPTPTPVPGVEVDPEQLDFGVVVVEREAPLSIRVFSVGTAPLEVRTVSIEAQDEDYRIAGENCVEGPIPPDGACSVEVVFQPIAAGERTGSIVLELADLGPRIVRLVGIGEADGVISISPEQEFVGTTWKSFTVSATGPVRIVAVSLEGKDPDAFLLDGEPCLDQPELDDGGACVVQARLKDEPEVDHDESYTADLAVKTAGGNVYRSTLQYYTIVL